MTDHLENKYHSKVFCKECQQLTWHNILNRTEKRYNDDESGIWEITDFFTLQCLGCENVCLLIVYIFSEDINPVNGQPEEQISIHPSPYKSDRSEIDRVFYVPNQVKSIYLETLKAFNSGMLILTAIGIRSILEAVSIDQGIKDRGIETKINKIIEK